MRNIFFFSSALQMHPMGRVEEPTIGFSELCPVKTSCDCWPLGLLQAGIWKGEEEAKKNSQLRILE